MAKVLIVDDAEMNAEVLSEIVRMNGPETKIAFNGKEAVDLVRGENFDLIFMDHLMPVMDGMEALLVIKREKLCEGTPIVMITANDSTEDGQMYIEAGFSDYMRKPFSAEVILSVLKKYKVAKSDDEENTWEMLKHRLKGIDLDAAKRYCLFDSSFYMEILQEYIKENAMTLAEKKYDRSDPESFKFVVGIAKDNARLIGAAELVGEALLMEEAIRNDNGESFAIHFKKFLQLEKKLKKAIEKAEILKNSYSC
ncbi:response regulator [Butyrivibrio sp. AE3004]|uniref:response regulator n=1 Tax=Butyrivibrio sp. AE3004 TaxID=1506994 RepID=UPI00068D9287|nr:response regulator [Butyrivibrio sp. AE3004]